MKSLLSKLKFLNAARHIIFFIALLFSHITPFVLNKQSIADFKCLNTHINCLRKLFNETDVFRTYEYVRKQNTCLHPCNDHVLCHLTVFTFVCIAQYHVLFHLYHKSGCSCILEKDLKWLDNCSTICIGTCSMQEEQLIWHAVANKINKATWDTKPPLSH